MATLVLSTVGSALGGPIGGAIGSLIGQTIDQQLFGPGPRQGPRLGDLAVQTSTYGTALPRIYGTMRVAGTVVWATELKESSELQPGGKGQPDVLTYSYSASLAVALSSRLAQRVKRIWADGKLLRGAAGDFKVRTGFRFYPGGEDEGIDPLIGSIEGIGGTPAYRGLALAVFEELELAEFGNRIPFLTFEVEADEVPPTLGKLLGDASGGAIDCSVETAIEGYAAHGSSVGAALHPLIEHYGIDLCEDGAVLRSPAGEQPFDIGAGELGCGAGNEAGARLERTQRAARDLPSTLTLGYYDPARDYQPGQMGAAVSAGGPHEAVELPACLTAESAKALAHASLARRWGRRERLTLRLPPSFLSLLPGSLVRAPDGLGTWTVERVTIEEMVVIAQLRPLSTGVAAMAAEPGRQLPAPDVLAEPTVLAMLDLPDLGVVRHDVPVLHVAACTTSGAWRPVPLEISVLGELRASQAAVGEAVIGTALTVLGDGQAALFDMNASIDVELRDGEHWLESRDGETLANGGNLAAVGSELIQFGVAGPIGERRFRLSKLLRGRRGTEWAMATHATGEPFVMLAPSSLRAIELPPEATGASVQVRALAVGDGDGTVATAVASGEALRPPSPVHLRGERDGSGNLHLTWARRSRSGWAWLNQVEAPLGEASERYRVRVQCASGVAETETTAPAAMFDAAAIASIGQGEATVTVRQIGDRAMSRPASMSLQLQ